jgi:glycosyltransferase involved in cell wall biosynthesis
MKILIRQFLGKSHSWSVVGWGIANSLIKNHDVHLFSTDGIKHMPSHLLPNVIGYTEENDPKIIGRIPDTEYDCQISYTCMKNFPWALKNGNKNRFGIWCYEWAGKNVLPTGFAKAYQACDLILAPSQFAKQVFMDSGVPESAVKVISHGINSEQYSQNTTIKLPTNKKYKLFANIAQTHLRKNVPGLLKAYGKAFNKHDDVCLILKFSKVSKKKFDFEIAFDKCLHDFYIQFPNHAEVKIFTEFVEDISSLYRSVDTVITLAHCEGFYFPGLESLASGKSVIAPNWGGQLDFLNDNNSLLITGKEVKANPLSMYWENKNNAIWFEPDVNDAVEKMKFAYQNYESLNAKLEINRNAVLTKYSWNNITNQIMELCV